jgi:hypothetical protein
MLLCRSARLDALEAFAKWRAQRVNLRHIIAHAANVPDDCRIPVGHTHIGQSGREEKLRPRASGATTGAITATKLIRRNENCSAWLLRGTINALS